MSEVTSGNLTNTCASRTKFNRDISVKLDLFHCMRRLTRECVSEHHNLHSSFCQFLSAAFTVVDQDDLKKLKDVYTFCGIVPANPTKQHIRQHCRTKVCNGSFDIVWTYSIKSVTQCREDSKGVFLSQHKGIYLN